MKIEGRKITMENNYLDPVTYVPNHANGNAQHKHCEQGVIVNISHVGEKVFVLYCKSRTVQATEVNNLVWG